MWNRKQLKKAAKKTLKNNYWSAVIVCLILAYIAGQYPQLHSDVVVDLADFSARFRTASNSEIVNSLISNLADPMAPVYQAMDGYQASRGILAGVFNNITSSGSFVFGVLNAVNQFIFGDRVMAGVVILIGAALLFVYWLLVSNLLHVGACRFFLESREYPNTKVNRLLYLYRIRRIRNPAWIMFLRALYTVLWAFTIVGGPIKYYAYRMVPYIVAENPDIPAKEAFALSRRMMHGNKWKAFLFDMSFLGWEVLSSLTFSLVGILFVNPYKGCADAELYLQLRATVADADTLLNDPWLAIAADPCEEVPEGQYPVHLYPIPEATSTAWLSTDYLVHYTLPNVILLFFAFCMVGWVWEVFVDLFNKGVFVNRGTLYGPWLPIYGTGGVGVVLLFRKLGRRPWLTFAVVTLFCGVLEYFTSWVLERFAGERWWDYTGYFLNINGRVCLEGLIVFGIGGCVAIYFAAPALNNLFDKIPAGPKRMICGMLVGLFVIDIAISAAHPNTAAAESDAKFAADSAASQSKPAAQCLPAAGSGNRQ